MDRAKEEQRFRQVLLQTGIAILVAAVLLIITYLWLFNKLLS